MVLFSSPCRGGIRHFGFLYEAPTALPGTVEIENYATSLLGDIGPDKIDFRHELEFGISDRLQAGFYLANWTYTPAGNDHSAFRGGSLELIYNFSNPADDPIGISVYQEIRGGRRSLETESKLIAQRNFGPLIMACNLTLESEWEEQGLRESTGEFRDEWGASYEIVARFSAGFEIVHEVVFPGWNGDQLNNNLFIGPNFSYRNDRWFVTVTGLGRLVTDTNREPDLQVRLIFGFGL